MQVMALLPQRAMPNIYLICRVYNLGQDNIGFRIYIDPYTMHIKGELEFTPDAYAVTPTGKQDLRAGGASMFGSPATVKNPFTKNLRKAKSTGFGNPQTAEGQFGRFGATTNTRPEGS